MDWKLALELVSLAVTILVGGRFIGRVEAAVARLVNVEAKLDKLPALETKVQLLDEFLQRQHSDHRELARKVDETREDVTETRTELKSFTNETK